MEHQAKLLLFELNKQLFAVDTRQVLSVEKIPNVTEVPQTSPFIRGMAEFHGVITPIIDLKSRLQVAGNDESTETRVLLVAMAGLQMGLMVDEAKEVREMDPTSLQPIPPLIRSGKKQFLKEVIKAGNEIIILLDLQEVLDFEDMKEIKKITEN